MIFQVGDRVVKTRGVRRGYTAVVEGISLGFVAIRYDHDKGMTRFTDVHSLALANDLDYEID